MNKDEIVIIRRALEGYYKEYMGSSEQRTKIYDLLKKYKCLELDAIYANGNTQIGG